MMVQRSDAVIFIKHAYREPLRHTWAHATARKLRRLAAEHGSFVRVLPKPGGMLELVLANAPGYVLGESVWHHFGEPDDLVYCEAVSSQRVLLVRVRDCMVLCEREVALGELHDELAVLKLEAGRTQVRAFGESPLLRQVLMDLDLEVRWLTVSALAALPAIPGLQLQPLSLALRQQSLGRRWRGWGIVLLVCAACVFWGWQMWRPAPPVQVQPVVAGYDVQAHYHQHLHAPEVTRVLDQAVRQLWPAQLAGWRVAQLRWQRDAYTVALRSVGGTQEGLWHWLQQRQGRMLTEGVQSQGAGHDPWVWVRWSSGRVPAREVVPPLAGITSWRVRFMDAMQRWVPMAQCRFEQITTDRGLRLVQVRVMLDEWSPSVMQLVGQVLSQMPVVVRSLQFRAHGMVYAGDIRLTLVGGEHDE